MHFPRVSQFALLALLFTLPLAACHREEQAVAGVAKTAANAEQKAQAKATQLDQQRAALQSIPLPTKSMYVDVHEPSAWANPFLTVEANMIDLRITLADANTSALGRDPMLRPTAARRQEMQIRPSDLTEAVVDIPVSAWRYGRVIAIAEAPNASRKDRPAIRRNSDAAVQQLNGRGVVVELVAH